MIKIKLNKEITLLNKSVIIEDTEISTKHINMLREMCEDSKSNTLFNIPTSDIFCLSIIYDYVNIYRCRVSEIDITKNIHGVLLDTLLVLVDRVKGTYGYSTVDKDPNGIKVNGTLVLNTRELNKLKKFLYTGEIMEDANITIARNGDTLLIHKNDSNKSVIYEGAPNAAIFECISKNDDCWCLGSLICSGNSKQLIIDNINKLFKGKESKFELAKVPISCFDYSYLNFNDLFAKVRASNTALNDHIIKRDSNSEILHAFWDMFYTRLYMLKASGIDLNEVYEYREVFDNSMVEQNYQKVR